MSKDLTEGIKRMALDMGVAKAGIASRENLEGPPEAVTDKILSGARAVISILVVEPEDKVLDYLSKENPTPYRDHFYENIQLLGRVGVALAEELRARGHKAEAISPNGVYRSGSNVEAGLKPPFSHRYAAVAAGLGAIGLSGNVVTPEYGARVYLSSVITDAPLEPDQPLDENPCDGCKTCANACPARFMSLDEEVTFTMGGKEITHAKKGIHARCAISCMGLTGLSRDGKWSTLAPAGPPIPEDDKELVALFYKLTKEYFERRVNKPELPNFARFTKPMPGYPDNWQGILARNQHDTHTTCGNCAIVCFETKPKRAKALKTLLHSGLVEENEDGNINIKRA